MTCILCDDTGYSGGDMVGNRTPCACGCHPDGYVSFVSAGGPMLALPDGMTYTPARLDAGVLTILRDNLAEMAKLSAGDVSRVRLDFCRKLTDLLLASLAPPVLIYPPHRQADTPAEITPETGVR